jgi:RNA polymerase sigma factor (sigma-70 family)
VPEATLRPWSIGVDDYRQVAPVVHTPRTTSAGSDADLLYRCRAGDPDAWRQLVVRYERLVYSVALRNGVAREDAADVTQATFVALLGAINDLRDDERLSAWLMTVARRQAWRVRRGRDQEQPLDELVRDDENAIEVWEDVAAVHEALQRLAAPCRELLHALYFDPSDPSYASVAQRLGRAVGAIGPMRGRCLKHLRALMDQDLGA